MHRVPSDPEYTVRVREVAQYEWRPVSGCRKRPFSSEAFVKRMLRSKAGLVFVGGERQSGVGGQGVRLGVASQTP